MLCINSTAWLLTKTELQQKKQNGDQALQDFFLTLDFSSVDNELRGFSDVIRIGKYAYFSPLNFLYHVYSSKTVRLYLGFFLYKYIY
jgi:hypothetical protein